MTRAASIARQASAKGLKAKTRLLITPGSEQVRATIERDGAARRPRGHRRRGARQRAGPCIGQWARPDMDPGTKNTIVNSYNRQLPEAQRRLAEHAELRHLARHGDRPRPRRPPRLQPGHGRAADRGRRGGPPRRAPGHHPSRAGLRPRAEHLHGAARRRLGRGGPGVAHLRSPPAARALQAPGTARTTSSCPCCSRPRASAPPTTSRWRARG
ncbi:MAG: aconitase family protein [Acidimicrobiales bacterium]